MLNKLLFYTAFILVIIFVGFIIDIYLTFIQLKEHNGLIAYGYIGLYLVLISLISIYLFNFIVEFRKYPILNDVTIKDFRNFQIKNNLLEKKKLLEQAVQLLTNSSDSDIKQKVQIIHSQMMVSNSSEKDYDDLKEISAEIDKKAKKIIIQESVNVSIMTGISQKSSLDMVIVFYKNISLIRQLLRIYGYRPNTYNTLVLTKEVAKNVFGSGAVEEGGDLIEGIAGVVGSFVGGITNGILTARVGNACRKHLSLTEPDPINTKEVAIKIAEKAKKMGLKFGDALTNYFKIPYSPKLSS